MQVDFYHLDRSPVERVLPRIAERILEGGGRLIVVSGDDELAARIDEQLWTHARDAFLPHGRAGGTHDARQPILIGRSPDPANGARHIALADGHWREEALDFERAFYFFDGETIGGARLAWKGLKGRDGVQPRFWKQDEAGKWVQGP